VVGVGDVQVDVTDLARQTNLCLTSQNPRAYNLEELVMDINKELLLNSVDTTGKACAI
jgi:hypothetical protein